MVNLAQPGSLIACTILECVQVLKDRITARSGLGRLPQSRNRFGPLCPSYPLKPIRSNMSNMALQETVVGTEAGKLQTELRDVFSKILSHARTIDMTLALGDTTEALGQVRELESYLERGLVVLSRPLTPEP